MHKQRLGILIAAGVGIAATFLPWANIPLFGSIYGTEGDGWITLGLFAITGVMAFLGDRKVALTGAKFITALLTSALAGAIGVWKIIDPQSAISELGAYSDLLGETVSIGVGLYLLVLAAIAAIVLGFVLKGGSQTAPSSPQPAQPAQPTPPAAPAAGA